MAERLADRVTRSIDQAAGRYHRLVNLVAPTGSGKTAALQEVHERTPAPLVNVHLELCWHMLDLTKCQRASQVSRLLAEIVGASASDVVLLNNIEVLFDMSLSRRTNCGSSRGSPETEQESRPGAGPLMESIWSMQRRATPNIKDIPYEIFW